ncbi:hypothetical protein Glove_551g9 [Diversispora epigaea]|uniref:Uncharacterized protein n=1 Tax=Diversispora epigaea TaxID=1348612 RepID=A0A397GF33_9GLOM|nr:hypothetical protein Glove_551g9 [Diversispora epigaea]
MVVITKDSITLELSEGIDFADAVRTKVNELASGVVCSSNIIEQEEYLRKLLTHFRAFFPLSNIEKTNFSTNETIPEVVTVSLNNKFTLNNFTNETSKIFKFHGIAKQGKIFYVFIIYYCREYANNGSLRQYFDVILD